MTGDARRALDASRLAVDICIEEIEDKLSKFDEIEDFQDVSEKLTKELTNESIHKIDVQHSFKALQELFGCSTNNQTSSSNLIIKSYTKIDKIVLKSILNSLKNSGGDTAAVGEIMRIASSHFLVNSMSCLNSKNKLSRVSINNSLQKLASSGIIDFDNFKLGPLARGRSWVLNSRDIMFGRLGSPSIA